MSMRSEKNAVRDSGQNAKQKRIGVWVNALLLSIVVGSPVYSATVETEVGVTAVSVTNAVGKPPISPARDLETGLEVFFNEKITTNASGRAQLLFRDGTSLTVGSSSEMTIDEYVFDPDTDTGELVINISKGIFRLVGGKISKNTPVVFNTKTATVTLRGGIGGLTVSNEGVEARNHFGHMTMQNKLTGLTNETFKSGNALRLKPGALTAPTKQKIDPEKLAAMSSALERPVKKRSSAAEESTTAPQPTESETAASQAEEGQAETDQPETAGTEPTAQPSQEEKVDSLPTEPGADTEVATVESQVDTEGIPPEPGETSEPLAGQVGDQALVTKAQPDRDEPPVMADPKNLSSDPLPAGEVTVSKGVPAPDMGTKLDINVLVVDLNSDVSPSTMGHEPGMTIDNIAVVVDAITKAPGVKTDEGKPVTNPMPTDEIIGATNPGQKPGKPPVEPCDPAKEKCGGGEKPGKPPVEPCDPAKEKCGGGGEKPGKPPVEPCDPAKEKCGGGEKPGKPPVEPCDPAKEKCGGGEKPGKPPVEPCDPAKEKCGGGEKPGKPPVEPCDPPMICDGEEEPPVEPCDPAKEKCDGEEEPPVDPCDPSCEGEEEPPMDPCDPSCEGEEDPPVPSSSGSKRDRSMAMIYREGSRLHISSTVTTKGAMLVLSSDYRHLCRVCSYLEWRRDVLWPTGRKPDMASIRYWLSGVSTTQAELAAAASKTAQYSGGLFGNVSTVGHITEKLGHFDAKVRFGVSHYQIQHFNAAFDGRNYLGNSAITPNNALFSAIGSSGKRQMSAQGYFFGNPARGTPPPEIGGHFQITGGGYDAGGIFAGARH